MTSDAYQNRLSEQEDKNDAAAIRCDPPQGLTIRPFQDKDAAEVEALLQALWGHDPTMLVAYRMHRQWPETGLMRHSLVAALQSEIVAAATIFESSLHPTYLYVVINVALAFQRQGIGTALLTTLRERAAGRPLMAKAAQRNAATLAFLVKQGFAVAVHTITGLLDPRQESVALWLESLPSSVEDFRIAAWQPDANTVTRLQLAQVHADVYAQFHAWNPLAALSDDVLLARFCGDDIIEGSSFCAFAGRNLCGAASLIRNPFPPDARAEARNEAYLIHAGVTGIEEPAASQLTRALIRRSILWAGENNYTVRFEADSTYAPHYTLFNAAPAADVDRDFVALLAPS